MKLLTRLIQNTKPANPEHLTSAKHCVNTSGALSHLTQLYEVGTNFTDEPEA